MAWHFRGDAWGSTAPTKRPRPLQHAPAEECFDWRQRAPRETDAKSVAGARPAAAPQAEWRTRDDGDGLIRRDLPENPDNAGRAWKLREVSGGTQAGSSGRQLNLDAGVLALVRPAASSPETKYATNGAALSRLQRLMANARVPRAVLGKSTSRSCTICAVRFGP